MPGKHSIGVPHEAAEAQERHCGGRAFAIKLHAMGARCGGWIAASRRWDDGPIDSRRKMGERSGRGSLQLRHGHAVTRVGERRSGARRPARIRNSRS